MIVLFFSKTKQFSRNPFECQLHIPKYRFLETQNTVLTETELLEKFMIEILVLFSVCLGKLRRRVCQSRLWFHFILFAPNLRLYKGNGPCTVGQQGKLKNQTRLVFNVSFCTLAIVSFSSVQHCNVSQDTCLVPVRLFSSPYRSIYLGDVSEVNRRERLDKNRMRMRALLFEIQRCTLML